MSLSPSRASASSSSSRGAPRPATAPVNPGGGIAVPPRSIRTAPAPANHGSDQNVRVVARVRPLSSKEVGEGSGESIAAQSQSKTVRVAAGNRSGSGGGDDGRRRFEFDSVFGPSSTQKEVYENACGDMISSSVFKGFNATILAYGQTGSGKTYTMGTDGSNGGGGEDDMSPPPESEGVIGRAVHDLFRAKESLPNGSERVEVTMSYLEIYNEQAIDLLNDDPASANQTLQVRDSRTEGVVIPNLKHFAVASPGEVSDLMGSASLRRATASTHMNAVSSRSHAICTLNVTIAPDLDGDEASAEEVGGEAIVSPRLASQGMRAKLTLVDLAGSERIKRTGAEGARMKEGININKGLFVLGQVVSALSELGQRNAHGGGSGNAHIPYRDSKLTRLLQDSLGGNSRTVMIACISPAESNIEESINTLRYAERTRNIKNSAVRNVVSSGLSASEAAALRRENQQLKLELARMESKMIVSGGRGNASGGNSFPFAGVGFVPLGGEDAESLAQLRAQCSSLLAEVDLLKGRTRNQAREVLEASLRADKWQAKSEAVARLAMEQGVALPEETEASSGETDIVSQLRNQLNECKAELLEARAEAAVARATAGAVIAGNGDLSGIEEAIVNGGDAIAMATSPSKEDIRNNEKLTTELSSVSATIEQKEAMVMQMNKERACMDNLQQHFENSLKLLQMEVDALTAERDELVVKMSTNNDQEGNTKQRRKRKANDPVTKKLRGQISKLEGRIDELKLKASDHKKSLKMKEEAQKKCERLTAEIAEDKRRRAELQRKLKEASAEMRAEKKAARQEAARMMKDSRKLKVELMKMKSAAQKQAAVLKRKIDQASAREKARVELARKRRSAERMRLASSSSDNFDIREERKAELASWIDRELDCALIRFQIEEQRRQLERVASERKRLMKNSGDTVDVEELGQMDATIRSLRSTVHNLEMTAKNAFPAAAGSTMTSNFRFLETDTFKGLSKPDAKYVLSYVFDACSAAKREMAATISDQESTTKSSIESALAKRQQVHEKELMKVKMEHAEVKLDLLEATEGILNSNIKIKMENDGTEEELRARVDGLLENYNQSWASAAEGLKTDLDVIRDGQEGLEAMMEKMAKGMVFVPKKAKAKKKAVEYDSEAFESEESFVDCGGAEDEDSEYEPTPTKAKRKRRSPRLAKKAAAPDSPSSPIGENFIEEIDNKRVGSLKKACKKLGVPMTGKKADLKQRVRETILNSSCISSLAVLNCSVAEGNDESFVFGSSALNKDVNFEGGMGVDPEFQPIAEDPASTESIKKQLWEKEPDDASDEAKPKPAASSAAPFKSAANLSQKLTPFKRKKSPADPAADKENGHSSTPKRQKEPFGFLTSSPRPLSSHNAERTPLPAKQTTVRPSTSHNASRTPVHMKQTIATAKKRMSRGPEAFAKKKITASTKKRSKRGMADAVTLALQKNRDLLP